MTRSIALLGNTLLYQGYCDLHGELRGSNAGCLVPRLFEQDPGLVASDGNM